MRHFLTVLSLLAVFLASCSPQTTAIPTPEATPAPTMTPTPVPASFIILAYAPEGIIPELIPYEQLTHINYSFLTPREDGTFNPIINSWKLKQIVNTAHQHDVRVNIAVGGWGWDAQFEEMAASPEARSTFVGNLIAFVEEYQLDGVDIDWEYPDAGPSSQNFLALIRALRTAMPDKLLTTAVVAYGDANGGGIPTESLELFDFVNIMAYDSQEHGSLEEFNKGLEYWQTRGVAPEKMVMGVPFYSHPEGLPGQDGVTYAKLVEADPAAAQTDEFDYYGVPQVYNGIPTIQRKTSLAMERAAGIMFWTLNHDAQGELSLVNAIYRTVYP